MPSPQETITLYSIIFSVIGNNFLITSRQIHPYLAKAQKATWSIVTSESLEVPDTLYKKTPKDWVIRFDWKLKLQESKRCLPFLCGRWSNLNKKQFGPYGHFLRHRKESEVLVAGDPVVGDHLEGEQDGREADGALVVVAAVVEQYSRSLS